MSLAVKNAVSNGPHWMETARGNFVNLVHPDTSTISIKDIAHSLARQSRYFGHSRGPFGYSIAQHSVWVADYLKLVSANDVMLQLYGLLHDAHEAYLGDLIYPLKSIPEVRAVIKPLEKRMQACIHASLDISRPGTQTSALIQEADAQALAIEAIHLMPSKGNGWDVGPPSALACEVRFYLPWTPAAAESAFMVRYSELYAEFKRREKECAW